ncbi:MAG: DUF2520 domain-containing protein [Bacteroidales bacterium]|nr:DUF2520 domain-containing protein [Bacteroidales bacterium]
MDQIKNIVILGAGNVAAHLSQALAAKGFDITQIYSRTEEKGRRLAALLGTGYAGSVKDINPDADLYIMALSDTALSEIAMQFNVDQGIVVHTSGSVGMDVLKDCSNYTGVVYPLQTFREGNQIPFDAIPVCVEASDSDVEERLLDLAGRLSTNVRVLNSGQRKILHLTAVFASNFTNYLYTIAEDLLLQNDIPFDLLEPLIMRTAANASHSNLFSLQTGPAVRGDTAILESHMELLSGDKAYKEIYELISKQIIQHKHRHGKL